MQKKEDDYMAKPIDATPILRGEDLIQFVKGLQKKDSPSSQEKRKAALEMLRKAMRK